MYIILSLKDVHSWSHVTSAGGVLKKRASLCVGMFPPSRNCAWRENSRSKAQLCERQRDNCSGFGCTTVCLLALGNIQFMKDICFTVPHGCFSKYNSDAHPWAVLLVLNNVHLNFPQHGLGWIISLHKKDPLFLPLFLLFVQVRFQEVMLEKAELVDQQQSLEHSMLQLEGESSTIGKALTFQ